jgi:hypothetical protein
MLTLKIISTDQNGHLQTNLFSAERISHSEFDFKSKEETFTKFIERNSPAYVIGGMNNTETSQPFCFSNVVLYQKDGFEILYIVPYSEVYIMQDGKTIDTFIVRYYTPEV